MNKGWKNEGWLIDPVWLSSAFRTLSCSCSWWANSRCRTSGRQPSHCTTWLWSTMCQSIAAGSIRRTHRHCQFDGLNQFHQDSVPLRHSHSSKNLWTESKFYLLLDPSSNSKQALLCCQCTSCLGTNFPCWFWRQHHFTILEPYRWSYSSL